MVPRAGSEENQRQVPDLHTGVAEVHGTVAAGRCGQGPKTRSARMSGRAGRRTSVPARFTAKVLITTAAVPRGRDVACSG